MIKLISRRIIKSDCIETFETLAAALVREKGRVPVDPALKAAYDEKYRIYKRIYPSLKELFHAM